MRNALRFAAVGMALAAGLAFAARDVFAGTSYVVIDLTPSGFSNAIGKGIAGGQQVGNAMQASTGHMHPLLWSGTANGYVDLFQSGWGVSSAVNATNGAQQVGKAGGVARLWSGSSASCTNLHPAGYTGSEASSICGDQVVGAASVSTDIDHALLWNLGTSTHVDLHPTGFSYSVATATNGVDQAGYAGTGPAYSGQNHAILWHGSASNYVDLNPNGFSISIVSGIAGSQQVGNGVCPQGQHALLWHGAPNDYIDLNPSGYVSSVALATNGVQQVGWAIAPGPSYQHAIVWTGSATDYVDLNQFLPAGYYSAQATGIDSDGNIVGSAIYGGYSRAILWQVPEPTSLQFICLAMLSLLRRSRSQRWQRIVKNKSEGNL